MKRKDQQIIGLMLLLVSIFFVASCGSSNDETSTVGDWTRTTPFKGRPRSGAVTFTIGNKAFVGLGYDGDDYLLDFYMYDLDAGFWVAVDSFPGIPRQRAVAFGINGKGYVGLGYNGDQDKEELGDFWEFNPDAAAGDQWTSVKAFEGTARYSAIGFAIGSKGYVGTGYDGDSYNSDFWQYDPSTNDWTEIESYPGEKIWEGLSFVINDKAYICTGRNNGLHNTDFWQFDPSDANGWTNLTPDDDESYFDEFEAAVERHDAAALVVNNKAYIIGGIVGSASGTVYEFDPATLAWDDRTSFEGSYRSLAVAFTLGGKTFYGTGQNGTSRYDDIWQFDPTVEHDESY
jgi:N-acetylneuraminic acid mutarotase